MGVYRRPDSPFWWICLDGTKPPVRESTAIPIDGGTPEQTKANLALAKQAYSVRMGDLARRRHRLPVQQPMTTFAVFRAWYEAHVTSTKRGTGERSMLKSLGHYFDPISLADLTERAIIEWRTLRAKALRPSSVNRELILLKHILTKAVSQGYLEANPAAGVSALRVVEEDVRLLEPDEETRLLAVCTPEEKAIVICALDTLQRLSNVAGLKRAQDHGTYLTVLNPKVKGYKVPVSKRLRAALDALPKAGPFYFPSVQSRTEADLKGAQNRMQAMFRSLLARAGLPPMRREGGLSFHCLRHTGASRMLARGVDIKTVQQIGGWQNIHVLEKYLHPTDAQRTAAVEAISRE